MLGHMGEARHPGGCHCGKVRYEVTLDLESPVLACNCSMCGRSGTLLAFVPASDFELLSGEDSLTGYRFNKRIIEHLFCSICGIKPFARGQMPDGTQMAAINVRCLDGIELGTLKVESYDGAAH